MAHKEAERITLEKKYTPILQEMTIEQLHWLNHLVIDTIKTKEDIDYQKTMRTFKRGDIVTWLHNDTEYEGWVIKTNKKTINVTEKKTHRQWKIDPNFLTKAKQIKAIQ